VIGCYLCKMSMCDIFTPLNIPRSTVSDAIVRWKREGTCSIKHCAD